MGGSDPSTLATSYLSGVPRRSADFGPRVMAKVVDLLGLLVIVGVLVVMILIVPDERLKFAFAVAAVLVVGFGFAIYTIVAEWRRRVDRIAAT